MLDSTIINVSFRMFFVRKIKGWSSPFSLNNTNWNAFKQVINNYTIYYWSQVITSSAFKSWHKKKNSISIPYRTSTKLSSLNFSKKTTTTTNTGISNWDLSHCKNTNNHLTLTKAQMCNYFVYQRSLVHVVTLLIPLKQLTLQIWSA